jgi:diguanylate cyclase (GGDEF)-like protein/putative nucleotidyltransferase with HDIG domain
LGRPTDPSSVDAPAVGTAAAAAVQARGLQRVEAAIESFGRLPVLNATVRRLMALAADDEAGVGELVAALEGDQGLAADVLRYANSAAGERRLRARSVRAAVTYVGRRAIAQLAMEAATCRFLERASGNGSASIGQLHLHAAAVAVTAQSVALRSGASPEIAHLAGLLHDVGKLVLPPAFGVAATDAIAAEHPSGVVRARAEIAAFGVDHALAGALMARDAGVDTAVEQAIAFHHGGPEGDSIPSPEAACVVVADELTAMLAGRRPDLRLLDAALTMLSLTDDDLDELALDIAQRSGGYPAGGVAAMVADLERLAHTDDLTGLPNRRRWLATVGARLDAGDAGSILLCDVDRFKSVNDRYGHAAGDLVLTEVARVLSAHGTAGRLGGDEFALWMPGAPAVGDRAAAAILDAVDAAFAETGDTQGLRVGVSVGAASAPADGVQLSELLPRADEALYEAKHAGRGRAQRWAPGG